MFFNVTVKKDRLKYNDVLFKYLNILLTLPMTTIANIKKSNIISDLAIVHTPFANIMIYISAHWATNVLIRKTCLETYNSNH